MARPVAVRAGSDDVRPAIASTFDAGDQVLSCTPKSSVARSLRFAAHWVVTNPSLAVVRLHGRNAETWNIKGATAASERFNYDYSDQELTELAGSITELAEKVAEVHVVFNNNNEDQGQRNATTLMGILGLRR